MAGGLFSGRSNKKCPSEDRLKWCSPKANYSQIKSKNGGPKKSLRRLHICILHYDSPPQAGRISLQQSDGESAAARLHCLFAGGELLTFPPGPEHCRRMAGRLPRHRRWL
jgi:hypothetical protein